MELVQKPTEEIKANEPAAPEAMNTAGVQPIGANQLKKFSGEDPAGP